MIVTTATPPPTPPRATFQKAAQEDGFQVVYAPDELGKVDLVRRTEVRDGKLEQVERSAFGVLIGDGLFYDLNGNLSMVPFLAFYAPIEAALLTPNFLVDPDGPMNDTSVSRGAGGQVEIDPPGVVNSTTISPDFRINRPGGSLDTRISRQGDTVMIDPAGLYNEIQLTQSSDGWTIQASGSLETIELRRDGSGYTIERPGWFNSTSVSHEGDGIRVNPPGWFNSTRIEVGDEAITVNPPGWFNDTSITLQNGQVVIDPPGVLNQTTLRPA